MQTMIHVRKLLTMVVLNLHIYTNAMSGFDHRSPGIVNYALNNKNTYVELIADGVHVNDSLL